MFKWEEQMVNVSVMCFLPQLKHLFKGFYLFIFRERGREEGREGNINVWLPLTCPILGTWMATQTCAPSGN